MKKKYKVAILESYRLFSSGIKSLLDLSQEFIISNEAAEPEELFKSMRKKIPDVLIIDLIHCSNYGLTSIKKIRSKFKYLPILLIVDKSYVECFEELTEIGIIGFVFYNAGGDELILAIKKLLHRETSGIKDFYPSQGKISKFKNDHKFIDKRNMLTNRELSVLKLFCGGLSYKEIGSKLYISTRTVETHKKNIQEKLHIHSIAEMVRYAFYNELVN